MQWTSRPEGLAWTKPIANEASKRKVAERLAAVLKDGDTVGVGSGSTSFLTIQALAERRRQEGLHFVGIPTSIEVAMACSALGVPTASLIEARPDWSFDGADEVDPQGRLIKGRGGALYQEKLVMEASPRAFIVVDPSKFVGRLGEKFPVPVEIDPMAFSLLHERIGALPGVRQIDLRAAGGKDGPVITERGNLLLDVHFTQIAPDMHRTLKTMPGVVETGLFVGYDYELVSAD
jgi:ribose 5-phosphate isomerase A